MEARAGFLDRPVMKVLVASTLLVVFLFAVVYFAHFAERPVADRGSNTVGQSTSSSGSTHGSLSAAARQSAQAGSAMIAAM